LRITKNGTFIPGTLDPWSLCSVFGTAHAFNALIFGSFTADGGDTEGKLGVAGNLTIVNGYSAGYVVIGHAIPEQIGGLTDMLIVGGDFSDGAFGVNGNIVLGGLRTGPVRWMSNGNLIRQVNPIRINSQGNVPSTGEGLTFNELKTHLQVRSTILGTRAPNGIVSQTDDGILLKGEDPDLNVFSLPVTDVTSTRITIDVPADSTVLVNFTAATVEFNRGGIRVLGTSHEKVLLNFPNTSLLRSTSFQLNGSVLAPFADAEFSGGSIEGRAVIGGNVTSQVGFEFHNFEFLGEVCLDPLSTSTPPAIAYTFTVENTGNVSLTNVHVVDPLVPVSGSPVTLLPGESDSTTFSAELVLNAEHMEESGFSNTAWAYGTVPSGHSISANDTHVLTFPADTTPTPPAESLYPVGNKPDFVMKSLVLPETIATQNQTFSVTVQVSNEGDKSGDAGVLRIWPALPQLVPTETDAFVDVAIGHMGIGAVKTLDISSLVASGSYGTIHIRAQIVTATPEYSTGNNHTSDTYFFENPDAPWLKPDFVLRSVNLSPIPGIAGTRFTAVVQVANEGTKAGDAGVLALWAGSSRYANDLTDPDQQISVGTLAVGEVKSFTFENLRAPEGFGTFHTMAIVNHAAATVTESAVGNNHLGTTYSLIPVEVKMEAVSEGIKISWNSQSGFYYFVERSTSLTGDFEQIADNLEAVLPIHSYIDTAPPGGLVFYRVWGYKP
jgi:choice-of-anchor A domain-containing protein